MSEELTLDDVRLKDAESLSDEEKTLLKDNQDDLTDEERETYKVALEEKPAGEDKEGEEFKLPFKTQEEFDTYVEKKAQAIVEAAKEPEENEDEDKDKGDDQPEPFFDKGYKPKDWEEFAQEFFPKMADRMAKMTEAQKQKTTDELKKINEGFDQEIVALRESGEDIPEVGTKEKVEFDRELAKIGMKYSGVTNMKEAYEIYKVLHGAGNKVDDGEEVEGETEEQKKERINTAKKVLGGDGGGGNTRQPRKYKDIAGRTMDEAVEAAQRRLAEIK